MPSIPQFDNFDRGILVAGVVGILLAAFVLPSHHPDSAAHFGVGSEEATERARTFLEQAGYSTDDLESATFFWRSPELIDSLQATLGRRAAIAALHEGGRDLVPAHFWQVIFRSGSGGGTTQTGDELRVRVLANGAIWGMASPQNVEATRIGDPQALQRAFGPELDADIDDAFVRSLVFEINDESEADQFTDERPTPDDIRQAVTEGSTLGLGPTAAAAIAWAHIERTALARLPLALSSVGPHPSRGRTAARVRFAADEPVMGQRVATEVDVTATGTVLMVRTRFNEVEERQLQIGMAIVSTDDATHRDVLKYVGYALLFVLLAVVAVRRLSARVLDVRAALRDALVVAVASATSIILAGRLLGAEMAGSPGSYFVFLAIGTLINAFVFGALTFLASGAGESLARSVRPGTLTSLALARQGFWLNVPVGRAVVRGVALGCALIGVATLLMAVFASTPVWSVSSVRVVDSQATYWLIGSAVTDYAWYVFLIGFAAIVGLGALVEKWDASLVVPAVAVALAVLQVQVVALPGGADIQGWLGALMVGGILAAVYVRTDALTILLALLTARVLWVVREPLLMPGSPAVPDLVIAILLVGAVLALGFWGLTSGRDGSSLPRYEPDFVVEQRERARLQRELEIAREVQLSFLPRTVPDVAGLDLAARCVPADEVGGDYYDLVQLSDDRLAVIIGDVSGKGIQAAFYMTLVKGYIQGLACEVEHPAEVLQRLNRHFRASAPRGTFVSMIYGVIDVKTCTITFARAGHTPLLIKREGGVVESMRPPGIAIGMADDATFRSSIFEETVELCPDDLLVLYTDGISEAMDSRRAEFTDERVVAAVDVARNGAEDVLNTVVDEVQVHVNGARQHDDLTMVVVRIAPPTAQSQQAV